MEGANENRPISGQVWIAYQIGQQNEGFVKDTRNCRVAETGSPAFTPAENLQIANMIVAAPRLHAAARRALDWFQLPNDEYWAKYGQPEPGGHNTLAAQLMVALSIADGTAPAGDVPPSDDTQGKLF